MAGGPDEAPHPGADGVDGYQLTNEELQSLNEELQSANEELETAKEEMQSTNEELTTLNAELQTRNAELARVSDDMSNLLAATEIAILFLDRDLRIQRYTPAMLRLVPLIPTDVGRPLTDLATSLFDTDLAAKARAVYESLESQEDTLRDREGRQLRMRIAPYRTIENRIEGVVLTFADVSGMSAS